MQNCWKFFGVEYVGGQKCALKIVSLEILEHTNFLKL